MERNSSRPLTCSDDPPTSEVILNISLPFLIQCIHMDTATCFLFAVLTLMTLAGSLVYLEETLYITRKIPYSYKRTTYIWVTGAPPVIATTSCIGLWIPFSSMFTEFTASLRVNVNSLSLAPLPITYRYLSVCMHKFLVMMLEEAFILSLWPVGILFAQARSNLSKCHIVPKFALNQCVAVLSQAQSGVMGILTSTGTVTCAPPFNARARGMFMQQELVVMEMFIVVLVTRFYYRRRYSNHDSDEPVSQTMDEEQNPGDQNKHERTVLSQALINPVHWV